MHSFQAFQAKFAQSYTTRWGGGAGEGAQNHGVHPALCSQKQPTRNHNFTVICKFTRFSFASFYIHQ